MSIDLTAASSHRLVLGDLPASPAKPTSFAAWCKPNNNSTNQALICVGQNNATSARNNIYLRLRSDGLAGISQFHSETISNLTGAAYSSGSWQFFGCAMPTSGSAKVVKDTTITSGALTTSTPGGMNDLCIGAQFYLSSGFTDHLNGAVAEAAVWDVVLTDEEFAALARGMSPRLIRTSSLQFYAPLIRAWQDIASGAALTPNGSPAVSDHPRIYYS
jgi:hypothetical protein